MQATLLRAGLILTIIVLVLQPAVINPLLGLLFLGLVPGTTYTLPFWTMGVFYLLVIYNCLRYILRQDIYIGDTAQQGKIARRQARNKIVKQTKTKPVTRKYANLHPVLRNLVGVWQDTLRPKLKFFE